MCIKESTTAIKMGETDNEKNNDIRYILYYTSIVYKRERAEPGAIAKHTKYTDTMYIMIMVIKSCGNFSFAEIMS